MPCVFRSKPFSFKDVTEMPAARGTDDFNASAIRIGHTFYRTGNFIVKAGPAASRIEFVARTV